jgi:DNA-binding transcriptional LysR family regulator
MEERVPQADLNDIALFVKVIDKGGFAKAAREARLPTSTVSRAVARLEEAVGARLLHRTTRNVTPTEEGKTLYERSATAIATLEGAARGGELGRGQPKGTLRITAPTDLANTVLSELVVEFTQRYPSVSVELIISNRQLNLVEEGIDLAVRAGTLSSSSLVARKVATLEAQLFASPGYLERQGTPSTLDDLKQHSLVLFRAREGRDTWKLTGKSGEESVNVEGRISGDDFNFVRTCLLAGAGIGMIPRITATHDLSTGRLVRVLPPYEMLGAAMYVVYPSARQVPARVAAFRDLLATSCSKVRRGAGA